MQTHPTLAMTLMVSTCFSIGVHTFDNFPLSVCFQYCVDNEERMHPILADLKPSVTQRAAFNLEELEINFWKSNAQRYLKEIVEDDSYNTPKQAKNVIMFLGDGMSLTTVAATRVYLGGEAKSLSFEKFPHFGLAKVRNESVLVFEFFIKSLCFSVNRHIVWTDKLLILHAQRLHICPESKPILLQ